MTPNLDRLVQTDAVSFRHAYTQSTICTPSRCAFMTGWYPHVRGHRTMHHMLRPDEPALLKTLKDSGYCVWWGGKNDLVPAQHGYDAYCDVKYTVATAAGPPLRPLYAADRQHEWRGTPDSDAYYSFYVGRLPTGPGETHYHDHDWAMIEGAIDFIRHAPPDRPLCLYLPLIYPHPPYAVEDPWYSRIDRAQVPPPLAAPTQWAGKPGILRGIAERLRLQGWSDDRWRELRATYYGMCARVDHQFGRLMDALRDAGLYDDTAVFVFSDHGDFTGDYDLVEKTANTFEDCLTRVPLIVKPPAGVPVRARVSEALVELIDVPATVEALAGITPGHTHFGRSLLPLLADETDVHRDAVFCEGGGLLDEVRPSTPNTLLDESLLTLYAPRSHAQRADPRAGGKAVMCRTPAFKYVRRLYESDELYDLRQDPAERHNRIDDPTLQHELGALKERLLTFLLETADVVPHDADRRS